MINLNRNIEEVTNPSTEIVDTDIVDPAHGKENQAHTDKILLIEAKRRQSNFMVSMTFKQLSLLIACGVGLVVFLHGGGIEILAAVIVVLIGGRAAHLTDKKV